MRKTGLLSSGKIVLKKSCIQTFKVSAFESTKTLKPLLLAAYGLLLYKIFCTLEPTSAISQRHRLGPC